METINQVNYQPAKLSTQLIVNGVEYQLGKQLTRLIVNQVKYHAGVRNETHTLACREAKLAFGV